MIGRLRGRRRGAGSPKAAATVEQRVIRLGGQEIAYRLRRSARRSIALQVDERGVRVAAPAPMPVREVERFIVQHEPWLHDRLSEWRSRLDARTLRVEDGATLSLLGAPCRLRVKGAPGRSGWHQGPDGAEELYLDGRGAVSAALERMLRQRARGLFTERVQWYCARLGVKAPPVRLTSARTRWGSCSAKSGIRLNWRLIHLPPELIDYVAAHEVAHLLEMNHSPRFWAIVEGLCPDWRAARRRLNEAGRMLPVIEPSRR